jgi:copper chaperone NosL
MRRTAALLLLALLAACGAPGPREIVLHVDECAYCRMTVGDPRFAAQAVTSAGRRHVFDSIECLAGWTRQARAAGTFGAAWVTDFERPGTFLPADSALYLRATAVGSPMGSGLLAVAPGADVARVRREVGGGAPLDWAAVVSAAAQPAPGPQASPATLMEERDASRR